MSLTLSLSPLLALSLLCLLSPLSHAATTSSEAHQKSTTSGSKAHQETQIQQTRIKHRIESDPTKPRLINQSHSGGLVVEIHEKWFQRLECIELHWTFSLSPPLQISDTVIWCWVWSLVSDLVGLIWIWCAVGVFFSVLVVIHRSGTIVTYKKKQRAMEERLTAREKRLKSEKFCNCIKSCRTNYTMYIYTTIHRGELNC